ncbi:MAG: hypothetical protein EOP34_12115 [Rickettsiales bacterium]|nr:MAG: hypothetical protein EOP34_12115 [Rickettsiales bacterium]
MSYCKIISNNGNNNKAKNNKFTSNNQIQIGYVYLLLEHQTKSDRFMAIILVKYIISIVEHHIKNISMIRLITMVRNRLARLFKIYGYVGIFVGNA